MTAILNFGGQYRYFVSCSYIIYIPCVNALKTFDIYRVYSVYKWIETFDEYIPCMNALKTYLCVYSLYEYIKNLWCILITLKTLIYVNSIEEGNIAICQAQLFTFWTNCLNKAIINVSNWACFIVFSMA